METPVGSSVVESAFHGVARAPDVPIFALMVAFREDPSSVKLNLGMGVYRTEEGKPHLLNVVRQAEELIVNNMCLNKEYLHIAGLPGFNKLSAQLIFGSDSPAIKENRVATVQSLSGSGSLRIGAEFLAKHCPEHTVYIPRPTYGNHLPLFSSVGMDVKKYRYYDYATHELDFNGLVEDLNFAPFGATVVLHLCGHNPTGVDLTLEQWERLRQLIRSKGLIPFFDCAYQGFVSGDVDADALPIRMFVNDGGECIAAQSYSKTMGLYGERVGALNIVCKTAETASLIEGHLQNLTEGMYGSPPIHGGSIAFTILNDRDMYLHWTEELKAMVDRVVTTRQKLFDALRSKGTPGHWSHIKRQVGMFSLLGLNEEQIAFLAKEYHIYMPSDGRINMAGLSQKAIPYLADAVHVAMTRTIRCDGLEDYQYEKRIT